MGSGVRSGWMGLRWKVRKSLCSLTFAHSKYKPAEITNLKAHLKRENHGSEAAFSMLTGHFLPGVLCHYLAAQIVDNTTTLDLAAVNASITTYATNLFLTQLLHAFSPPGQPGNLTEPPSPDPSNNITNAIFTFMCGNLNCEIIDALQLDGPRIIEQVCAVVGLPPSNNTASTQDRKGASNATVDRYLYRRSALFGTLIALTARSQAEANAFCNSTSNATIALAPERFSALGMLPDEVNATLCGYPDGIFDPPPSLWGPQVSDDAQWRTRQVNNEMFATVVEVVVRDDGWTEFLCEWMDAEGLGSTGVDGETVIQIMCKDTRMGPPPKSRMRKRGIGM